MNKSINQTIKFYTGRVPTDLTLIINQIAIEIEFQSATIKIFKAENSYICKDLVLVTTRELYILVK